jgi:PhnB protein
LGVDQDRENAVKINPHVAFNGQCQAAFEFYARCLGGRIVTMLTYGSSPMAGQTAPELQGKIVHATLALGDTVVYGADVPPEHYRPLQGFHLTLGVQDPAEAERVFHEFAEGGKVEMPLRQTFWALRFGMLTDRFGVSWEINCEKPQ